MTTVITHSLLLVVVITAAVALPEGCHYTTQSALNCTHLQQVPANLSSDISMLVMNGNTFPIIKKNAFKSASNLRVLALQRNNIKTLEPESFLGLHHAIYLFLSENEIVRLPSRVFNGLDSLEILSLARNKIKFVDKSSIQELKNLKELYLTENNINSIDPNLFNFNLKLEKLDLSNNNLTISEDPVLYSKSLKHLSMEKCNVFLVTKQLFKGVPNLITINLANNNMGTLDHTAFLPHYSLKLMNLERNSLKCNCEMKKLWNLLSNRGAIFKWECEGWEVSHEQDELTIKDLKCQDSCITCKCSNDLMNCARSNLTQAYIPLFPDQLYTNLDASHNRISVLNKGIFKDSGLSKLKVINLTNNNISQIEDDAFIGLESLITLNLTNNKIVELKQKSFHGLVGLKSLELSLNKIAIVSEGVFENVKNIESLDLSLNEISSEIIVNSFKSLVKVKALSLTQNKINYIKHNMFIGLTKLTELDLSYNNISLIENNAFKNTSTLMKLDLSSNKITTLPENPFKDLYNLNQLNLSNNSILFIFPSYFTGLSNLQNLHLQGNSIERIDSCVFEAMYNLNSLNLATNKIEYLTSCTFQNLSKLSVLNLEHNNIQIFHNVLKPLKSLQILILNQNRISEILSDMFVENITITTLDLSENNITTINLTELQKLTKLKNLYVLANPLICDCRLKLVYNWCSSRKIFTRVVCQKPREFFQHRWDVLRKLKCITTTTSTSTTRSIITSKPSIPRTSTTMRSPTSTKRSLIPAISTTTRVTLHSPAPTFLIQTTKQIPEVSSSLTTKIEDTTTEEVTKRIEDTDWIETTVFSLSEEGYYNASFSQHQEADARVSSIILYLLVTLCVLFCILAGLLAKFVFRTGRNKAPSSNDISAAEEQTGISEIQSLRLSAEPTGIENFNFDSSKPATTGPICLPLKLIDTMGERVTNSIVSNNSTDLHPHQHEEVAIVHQADDDTN